MKNLTLELKWGVVFTIVSLLWMVIEKSLGWHDELIAQHATYTNIFAAVAILIYIFALREKKRQLGESVNYRKLLVSGTIISLIIAFLSPLAQLITHTFITPDYFSNAIAYAVETGASTQIEAETYFNLNSYFLQSSIGALILGVLTTAVVSIFLRK